MLRLTIMAALAILVFMPSCKKSDDSSDGLMGGNNGQKILGTWIINYAKVDGYVDDDAEGEYWRFSSGGQFEGYLSFGKKSREDEFMCNWTLDGNKLVLQGGELEDSGDDWSEKIVFTLNIDKLNQDVLVVSGKMKEDWTEGGEHGSYSCDVRYELEAK